MSFPVGEKKWSYLFILIFHKHLWGNSDDLSMAEHAKVQGAVSALEEPKDSLVRKDKYMGNNYFKTI